MEADCRRSLGQTTEATALLRQALELDPRFVPAKLSQANLLLDLEQSGRAVDLLEEAVRIEPANSQAHFQLSQALRLAGESERASEELLLMQKLKTLEKEFSELHETAANRPTDADVRYRIGELARQLERRNLATMWYRAALAIDPNHQRARSAMVEALSRATPHVAK